VSAHWRVVVTFLSEDQAERVLRQLHAAGEVRAAGGTISMPRDEPVLWVFPPDSASTAPIAAAVRQGTVAVGVDPLSVRVDEWSPEEAVWSEGRAAGTGSGDAVPSDLVNGVMDIIRGLLIWP
jgi:hypothetical protein